MKITAKVDLSKRRGCQFVKGNGGKIDSLVLGEVGGGDEELAAAMSKQRGMGGSAYNELIRLSIKVVNGKKVSRPYAEWDHMSSRARALVGKAFDKLNGTTAEDDDFLSESVEISEGETTPTKPKLSSPAPETSSSDETQDEPPGFEDDDEDEND